MKFVIRKFIRWFGLKCYRPIRFLASCMDSQNEFVKAAYVLLGVSFAVRGIYEILTLFIWGLIYLALR